MVGDVVLLVVIIVLLKVVVVVIVIDVRKAWSASNALLLIRCE